VLFDIDRHDDCVAILEEMAADPFLTPWFKLQVNALLAEAVDDLATARGYLATAKNALAEHYEQFPQGIFGGSPDVVKEVVSSTEY